MKQTTIAGLVASALCLLGVSVLADDLPYTENWFPSEWGSNDRIGALNRITPPVVMNAIRLVKKGRTATLGKMYEPSMPAQVGRSWRIMIPGKPTGGPFGENGIVYNQEYLATEIGQVGTQLDGPGNTGVHTSKGDVFYNGVLLHEDGNEYMLDKLGVHHLANKPYVCRGVLLDAAAHRGVKMLPLPKGGNRSDPGNVNDEDVKAMVRKQGLKEIGEGDCVFLHTGWGDLWDDANWHTFSDEERARRTAQFLSGEPGWGMSACRYLAQRKIAFAGADNWVGESLPGEEPNRVFDCHILLQVRYGIFWMENMQFRDLLADNQYEFLFMYTPLKIRGATGAPGNPVAIW